VKVPWISWTVYTDKTKQFVYAFGFCVQPREPNSVYEELFKEWPGCPVKVEWEAVS
jgi:hypothetical protein